MLQIAIDAAVLIGLIKSISDDDVNILTACLIALGAAIGVNFLVLLLVPVLGAWVGLLAAASIVGLLVGVAISALFGSEIKRSFTVGGVFVLVHILVAICFFLLFRRA